MVDRNYIRDTKLTGNKSTVGSLNNSYSTYTRSVRNSAQRNFGNVMNLSMNSTASKESSKNSRAADNRKLTSPSTSERILRRQSKVEYVVKAASHTGSGQAVDEAVVSDSLKVLSSDIKAVVCSVLDLTDDELARMLEEYGMCISDLLMPNNLAAFVAGAEAEGDTMILLTDSSASQLYSEINNRLDELLATVSDKMNITEDELAKLLAEYDIQQENLYGNTLLDNENNSDKELLSKLQKSISDKQTGNGEEFQTNAFREKMTYQSDKDKHSSFSGQENGSLAGQFVENLIKNMDNSLNSNNVFNSYAADAESVMRQIVDSIKVNVTSQTSEMELQLSPENLGKVNLLVEVKNGMVTAQLTAQNEVVKSIIENQLVFLKENFEQQGLKVEAIEVMVESHGFESGKNFEGRSDGNAAKEEHSSTRHLTLDEIDAMLSEADSFSEEELLAAEMMRAMGRSVDYTA